MKKLLILGAALLTATVFADVSNATVTTIGANGDESGDFAPYTAYLCTVAAAESYFSGNTTYAGITSYLKDSANFADGVSQIATGGILLETYEYDLGEYSFIKQFGPGELLGNYIALVTYANGGDDYFRVFESSVSGGSVVFDPEIGAGSAGAWTPVSTPSPTPEPTGGLLLLLGAAGLALRRRRA